MRTTYTSIVLLVAGSLTGAVSVPQHATARDGANAAILGGLAGGMLGGVAAGALTNGAQPAPRRPPYYAPPPPPRRVYEDEDPDDTVIVRRLRPSPVCHQVQRRVWVNADEYVYKNFEVCDPY